MIVIKILNKPININTLAYERCIIFKKAPIEIAKKDRIIPLINIFFLITIFKKMHILYQNQLNTQEELSYK